MLLWFDGGRAEWAISIRLRPHGPTYPRSLARIYGMARRTSGTNSSSGRSHCLRDVRTHCRSNVGRRGDKADSDCTQHTRSHRRTLALQATSELASSHGELLEPLERVRPLYDGRDPVQLLSLVHVGEEMEALWGSVAAGQKLF